MTEVCQHIHEFNSHTLCSFKINDAIYFDVNEQQHFGVVQGFGTINEHRLIMLRVHNIYTDEVVMLNPNHCKKFDEN